MKVRGPGGQEARLDAPDPALIGPWLKALFESYQIRDRPRIPIQFVIEIN